MKKLFQRTFMPVAAAVLVFGSCSDGETIYEPDGAKLPSIERIEPIGPACADKITVRITPSTGSAGYEFAIGTATDYEAFASGTLEREKAQGDQPTDYTFTDLEKNTLYTIYARVLHSDGTAGPVSSAVVRTFTGAVDVQIQFTGYESLAFTIQTSQTYQAVEYALVTSLQAIEEFEVEGGQTGKIREDDVFRVFTATFFDLQPETQYYLLIRAEDRYGNYTETLAVEARTQSPDKVPSIEISSDIADFWITRYTFTPGPMTGSYFLFYVEAGALDGFYMSMQSYGGDYLQYLTSQSGSSADMYSDEQTLPYVNQLQDLERGYEIFVLLFDKDGNPASVIRKSWLTPSYDPQAGTAEVGIRVEPSSKGATYYWTPNEATVGFYYETFTAELIDGNDPYNPGAKDEEWVQNWFLSNAQSYQMNGHWNYRYLPELGYWEDHWTDDSGEGLEPGTELVVYVMPVNINGLPAGIGTLTSRRYSTPQ